MPVKLRPRQEMKKAWMMMKFMLSCGSHLSKEQRSELKSAMCKMQSQINSMSPIDIDSGDIVQRRKNLAKNPELKEIFNMFWSILSMQVDEEGILSEDAYVQFNVKLQLALMGEAAADEKESIECAKADYIHDVHAYGEINEVTFRDVMMELIEVWSDMVNARYYTAFAWALLGSIVDINAFPPKFRHKKNINCITSIENESDILAKFHSEKKLRSNIQLKSEWMYAANLRPEVQERLASRRAGTFHASSSAMLDLLKIKHKENVRGTPSLRMQDSHGDSDDESEEDDVVSVTEGRDLNKSSSGAKYQSEDDDQSVTSGRSHVSGKRPKESKNVEDHISARKKSVFSQEAPAGALPSIMGLIASPEPRPISPMGLGDSTPTSRTTTPKSGRESTRRSDLRSPNTNTNPAPAPGKVGRGAHRQYGTSITLGRQPSDVKQEPPINFAEELKAFLQDVTQFSGSIEDVIPSGEDATDLKKKRVLKSAKSFNGFGSGTFTGSVSSKEDGDEEAPGAGAGKGTTSQTNALEEGSEEDMEDEIDNKSEVSESSQITTNSLGITALEVKSRSPKYDHTKGHNSPSEKEKTMMMLSSPSSLELLMEGAGFTISRVGGSTLDGNTSDTKGTQMFDKGKPANVWHPKRTQVKLPKNQIDTPKMKIAKEVRKERKKYEPSASYLPDIKRGKNPLTQRGMRPKPSMVKHLRDALVDHCILLNTAAEVAREGDPRDGLQTISLYRIDDNGSVREVSPSATPHESHEVKEGSPFFLTGYHDSQAGSMGDSYHVPSQLFMQNKEDSLDDTKAGSNGHELTDESLTASRSEPEVLVRSRYGQHRLGRFSDSRLHGSLSTSPIRSSSLAKSSSYASKVSMVGPWIPPGGLDVMVSDKTDVFFGHEENRDIGMVYENTKNKTIIGRQNIVRGAFEKYCRDEAKKSGLDMTLTNTARSHKSNSRASTPGNGFQSKTSLRQNSVA